MALIPGSNIIKVTTTSRRPPGHRNWSCANHRPCPALQLPRPSISGRIPNLSAAVIFGHLNFIAWKDPTAGAGMWCTHRGRTAPSIINTSVWLKVSVMIRSALTNTKARPCPTAGTSTAPIFNTRTNFICCGPNGSAMSSWILFPRWATPGPSPGRAWC